MQTSTYELVKELLSEPPLHFRHEYPSFCHGHRHAQLHPSSQLHHIRHDHLSFAMVSIMVSFILLFSSIIFVSEV